MIGETTCYPLATDITNSLVAGRHAARASRSGRADRTYREADACTGSDSVEGAAARARQACHTAETASTPVVPRNSTNVAGSGIIITSEMPKDERKRVMGACGLRVERLNSASPREAPCVKEEIA